MPLKTVFTHLIKAKSGSRFISTYTLLQSFSSSAKLRFIACYLILSPFLLVAGIIMLVAPGPGILFILLAILPVALIHPALARFLDTIEYRFYQFFKRTRRK